MWMMPLHLHVNQKSDYDMMMRFHGKESRQFSKEKKVTSLPVLIQFGGKHLKHMFGMLFISISDII